MHNVVSFLYYTAGSCIFNDDLESILYVPLLIAYAVASGVVSSKLCNFGNLKLRWGLHQSQNTFCRVSCAEGSGGGPGVEGRGGGGVGPLREVGRKDERGMTAAQDPAVPRPSPLGGEAEG